MKGDLATRPKPQTARKGPGTPPRRVPSTPPSSAALDGVDLVRLQALIGNEAVGKLLEERRLSVQLQPAAADCPPAPPPAPPATPHDDPKFKAVAGDVGRVAVTEKQHAPPGKKAAEAAAGAVGPTNEVASKAGAAQV